MGTRNRIQVIGYLHPMSYLTSPRKPVSKKKKKKKWVQLSVLCGLTKTELRSVTETYSLLTFGLCIHTQTHKQPLGDLGPSLSPQPAVEFYPRTKPSLAFVALSTVQAPHRNPLYRPLSSTSPYKLPHSLFCTPPAYAHCPPITHSCLLP